MSTPSNNPPNGSGSGSASGSALAGSSKSTATKTTVTTKRTVEEYVVRKKRPWWPVLAILGTVPMAFLPQGNKDVVAAPDLTAVETIVNVDTTLATETTLAAETTLATETTLAPETTKAVDTTLAAAPPSVADTTAPATGAKPIPVVATEAGNFKTLTTAIGAAGLTDTLMGAGKFTVFAPTDEAFAKLPPGVVDALLKPENKDVLTKILTYHVVPGETLAKDITAGDVKTVEGDTVKLTIDGGVKANDASVLTADIPASNGVIHAIDTVLLPPGVDVAALLGAGPAAAPESLTVYFANNSSAIDKEAQTKIEGAVEQLKKLPAGTKVKIVGHASKTGNSDKNQALSIDRGNNVRDALIEGLGGAGAASSKVSFSVEARGDTQPDVDEAKSRKVTIEIQP
jgi:uncharacterized surface protein with fasciclin (FAS1) repeats